MRKAAGFLSVFLIFMMGGLFWHIAMAADSQPSPKTAKSCPPQPKDNTSYLRYPNIAFQEKMSSAKGTAITKQAAECIACHSSKTPAVVQDWSKSAMAHAGISCFDCHTVSKDNPMANQNCPGVKGTDIYVSSLVSPKTCEKCHPTEVKQFQQSGHARGAIQAVSQPADLALIAHEDMNMPQFKDAVFLTGCAQCHGSQIKMGADHMPTAGSWPVHGIGTLYPDGGVGNCTGCHLNHQFSIAQARKPSSCGTCHLGPDHPDIEIYTQSVHGMLFEARGDQFHWDSPPGGWQPGVDYSAPTCATCHMSGVNGLQPTHNVDLRLKWNLWAPVSNPRTGGYDTAAKTYMETGKLTEGTPLAGNPQGPEAARKDMLQVCSACHSAQFAQNYLATADKQVELYNKYSHAASEMIDTLTKKNLMMKDPWADPAFRAYYYMWHHEGRRMRQGAVMEGPDYSHWHGVFQLQQSLRILQAIYNQRIRTGKIDYDQTGGVGVGE
ncbi:MAG: multiheme c-type cytochrome [Syntrophobacteraceae bacterium]|nr:multiheme c-type cytochrome [Syntrophobacteraceae bacterium]